MSASKCFKTTSLQIVGAPTRAVDKDSDRMWADEVSSADSDLMTSDHRLKLPSKALGCVLIPTDPFGLARKGLRTDNTATSTKSLLLNCRSAAPRR